MNQYKYRSGSKFFLRTCLFSNVVFLFFLSSQNVGANCDQETEDQRFRSGGEGVLVDDTSGLHWRYCAAGQLFNSGQCIGTPLDLSWNNADAKIREIAQREGISWRLPTLEDMDTIMIQDCEGQVLPSDFNNIQVEEIWTSSPGFPVNDVAAIVNLFSGEVFGVVKGVSRNFILVADNLESQ